MASLTLDDRTARIEVTVFNDIYEPNRELLVPDALLVVTGNLKPDEYTNGLTLIARSIKPMGRARADLADHLLLLLDMSSPEVHAAGTARVAQLQETLAGYRDDAGLPLRLHYIRPGARGRLRLGEAWRVAPEDALLKRLRALLGGDERVQVVYQRELPLRASHPEPAAPPRLAIAR
jgi:DNA polymerase-3 subunit alpha